MTRPLSPVYPPALEQWWLQQAHKELRTNDPRNLFRLLEPEAKAISETFTRERGEGMQPAYDSPKRLLAYGLYFFPRNFVRTSMVLEELGNRLQWRPDNTPVRVLDMGAGSGAASLSACQWLESMGRAALVDAVEPSGGNISLLRQVSGWQARNATWNFHERTAADWKPAKGAAWDLILLSFSLNEICQGRALAETQHWLQNLMRHLRPGGLLVILEPAMRETSERLGGLRMGMLAGRQAHVWAPCLHQAACPMLAKEGRWCHEVRLWSAPESLRRLNKNLFRDIDTVKFSFLVLGGTPPPAYVPSPGTFRMVSPMVQSPGRLTMSGCAADGRLADYDLLLKTLPKEAQKEWKQKERGDVLAAANLLELGGVRQYRLAENPPAI